MCVGDWRIGRFIRSHFSVVTTSISTPTLVASSQQRVGINFAADVSGNEASILVLRGSSTFQVGVIGGVLSNLFFNMREHGIMPTEAFQYSADPGLNIGITEFFLPEEVFALAYESLFLEYPGWPKQLL